MNAALYQTLTEGELVSRLEDARWHFWTALQRAWPMSWEEGLGELAEGRELDLLEREQKRRRAIATRIRQEAELAAAPPLSVGQRVEVYSSGRWHLAEVLRVGKSEVQVRYLTSSGRTQERSFPRLKVRAR